MLSKKARRLLFLETAMTVLIIYLLIIGITFIIDIWRINELDRQIQNQSIGHESFLASQSFYESVGITDCNFSKKLILDEYEEMKELSTNLASFKNRILKIHEKNHDLKKREFLIAQAENFNKVKTHNDRCDEKIYPLLYFVDGDVIGFNQQALILQQFTINNKNELIIYTLDINFDEEPVVQILLNQHNITKHNTIIFGNISNTEGGSLGLGRLTAELERMRQN